MKKVITLLILLLPVVIFAQLPELPGAEGSCYGSYLYDQPPIIYEVKQDKTTPAAGEEVNITCKIANDIEVTDEVTTEARLIYSIDGGKTWEVVNMEQDENKEDIWRGTIPAQPSGTVVIYYIQAVDTAGNLATEMPGESPVDAWDKLKEDKEEIPEGGILFTNPVEDEDCDESACPDNNDILKLSVAYSKSDIIAKLQVQGNEIDKGTISPVKLMMYGLGIINLDLGEDILKGRAIGYAPMAQKIPLAPGFGVNRDTIPFDESIQKARMIPAQSETGDDSVVKGNTLYLKLFRKYLGDNPSGTLKVISMCAAGLTTDINALLSNFAVYDATPFLRVYLRNHTYKVK